MVKPRTSDVSARIFAVLWAIAIGVHLWNHDVPGSFAPLPSVWVAWAALASCIGVLASAGNGRFLIAAAAFQVGHVLLTMPEAADHWMLLAMANVVLLVEAIRLRSADSRLLVDAAGPTLRALLLLCYGFAALSKLNWGFLDPDQSCAVVLAKLSAQFVPLGPDTWWMHRLHIGGSLVGECAIAALMILPRTRRVGLTLGVLFHTLISFTPAVAVFDFTATLFAFWWLFVPPGTEKRLRLVYAGVKRRYEELAPVLGPAARIGAIGLGLFVVVHHLLPTGPALAVRTLVYDLYAATICTLGLWAVWTAPALPAAARFSLRDAIPQRVGWVVFAIAVANVLAPYAGLKSVGSFTMYSNLRTETANNHLLFPTVPLSGNLADHVTIRETTDSFLQEVRDNGEVLPLHELQRRAHTHASDESVAWTDSSGTLHRTDRAGDDPSLDPSWWASWALVSRSVRPDGPTRCQN